MGKHIGFISTRFAGTDGVTLESSKWAQVLRQMVKYFDDQFLRYVNINF